MPPERRTAAQRAGPLNETHGASFPSCAIHFQGVSSTERSRFDYYELRLTVSLRTVSMVPRCLRLHPSIGSSSELAQACDLLPPPCSAESLDVLSVPSARPLQSPSGKALAGDNVSPRSRGSRHRSLRSSEPHVSSPAAVTVHGWPSRPPLSLTLAHAQSFGHYTSKENPRQIASCPDVPDTRHTFPAFLPLDPSC